ncbi:flagellin [Methanospirillum purgamenti]|uniref:Flagellin n=1 Tax=Methanospirillum hungatei TaxID=2203 RepID=A0A8F5VK88_METHU|nr:flagellin [Methanospirillum hungatei]QXO93546.1 flagellin [Methanospirillum hungatei]
MYAKNEGFTGLESAIILIAFVVVAAVFGMSVLSSGFFTAGKTEEVTVSGYKQASSAMYMEGAVYAYLGNDNRLDHVEFSAGVLETGQPQDLSKLVIVYTHSSNGEIRTYEYGGPGGAVGLKFGVEHGPIMFPGDKQIFTLKDVGGPIPAGWFTIELKPQMGPSTFVTYHLSQTFAGGPVLY